MRHIDASTAHALRVAALLLAVGAIGRHLTEDTTGDAGRQLLLLRAATAFLSITFAALASPSRSPRLLRVLAVLIGLTGGGGAIGVLIVTPSAVLEQAIIITSLMLGAALFVPWSWRWQAILAGALVLATAVAVPRVPLDPAWSGADAARMLFTVALMGAASVIGVGLADRERRRVASSEERYRSLFLGAGDAIVVLDADGIMREGNPRLAELLGEPLERLLERPLEDFYAPGPARPVAPDHVTALAGGNHSGPRLLQHAGGRRIEVVATFARVDSPAGFAIQAILHDLTNQRAAERRHEHQQRLSALANLAGGLAHQFNNLLAGILTHASVLRDDAMHAATHRELDEILGAARRGRDLAKELLRFTRNEPITLRPTAVADVLTGVAELARVSVPDTVAIDVRLPPELPAMAADADHLIHACLELVLNARDAMRGEPTGRVTIAAAAEAVGPNDPTWPAAAPGAYVRLSVSDTGVGMDTATLERMFEPFFTTKPMHQAVGLGLPRVYRVVREHQGSVRIESQRRRGTTVHILVPAAGVAAESGTTAVRHPVPPRPLAGGPPASPSATVLIVDDEEIVRSSLSRALTRFGYRVLAAWDGPTALATLQSANPPVDLVILDLVLPGGGSAIFELLKAVRPDIKVLVSSGYSPDEAQARALASRADGFLPKPYEIGELRTAVARALGRAA